MPYLTPLTTILNRMKRLQVLSTVEDQYLVRDLDEALREFRRTHQAPWNLKRSSLRVFSGVLEYPVASDHDELAYVDNKGNTFAQRARFNYKTLQAFYEDGDNRNDLAEIWDGGTRFLGVRYGDRSGIESQVVNSMSDVSQFSLSGVAINLTLDTVIFDEGESSIRFEVATPGTASISYTSTPFVESNYRRKYHFLSVYFGAVPTSVTLRFGSDASNYFYQTITTQFSGQPFAAGQWNVLAIDLGTALEFGTVDTNELGAFAGADINGATAGLYYIDSSYIRSWTLLDYWYYSNFYVALEGSGVANQQYFFNDTTDEYSLDSSLVGDSEFADVIVYGAQKIALGDKEDDKQVALNLANYNSAINALTKEYPSMQPVPVSRRWNFSWQSDEPPFYSNN